MKVETIAFKTEYAEKYGVECAILIQGIQLGLSINQNKHTHQKLGKIWMYNSVKDWHMTYPFMSQSTIKRALAKLKELNIIEVMQLDSNPMNKTNWYTLNQSILSKQTTPLVQNDPIEEVKKKQSNGSNCTNQNNINQTVLNNNVKQTVKDTKKEGFVLIDGERIYLEEAFEQVWKAYNGSSARQTGSKAKAKEKWLKLNANEISLIRGHLPKFIRALVQAKKTDYFPDFVTYLNQRRFEDEKLPYQTNEQKGDDFLSQFK